MAATHPRLTTALRQRQGMALLVCLFVISVTSALLVGILDTCTLGYAAARNTTDYEAALYLAGAGVHHALAELEQNPNWSAGIPTTEFPPGSGRTYSATIAAGANQTVIVTAIGTAGGTTRRLQATIDKGAN